LAQNLDEVNTIYRCTTNFRCTDINELDWLAMA